MIIPHSDSHHSEILGFSEIGIPPPFTTTNDPMALHPWH